MSDLTPVDHFEVVVGAQRYRFGWHPKRHKTLCIMVPHRSRGYWRILDAHRYHQLPKVARVIVRDRLTTRLTP